MEPDPSAPWKIALIRTLNFRESQIPDFTGYRRTVAFLYLAKEESAGGLRAGTAKISPVRVSCRERSSRGRKCLKKDERNFAREYSINLSGCQK
ncbi:MAG: hypothetical protein ABSB80_03180 [Methanoregula sp.]|uniref:hypothetical protein n=1 Tax=Methanoregula sp. TaxID=2052170 RepID=UPI003D0982E8